MCRINKPLINYVPTSSLVHKIDENIGKVSLLTFCVINSDSAPIHDKRRRNVRWIWRLLNMCSGLRFVSSGYDNQPFYDWLILYIGCVNYLQMPNAFVSLWSEDLSAPPLPLVNNKQNYLFRLEVVHHFIEMNLMISNCSGFKLGQK